MLAGAVHNYVQVVMAEAWAICGHQEHTISMSSSAAVKATMEAISKRKALAAYGMYMRKIGMTCHLGKFLKLTLVTCLLVMSR